MAGDWTGDEDLISQIKLWNESDNFNLHFSDAHKFTQARDNSLPCSIKHSLRERLNISKTFILIVGENTMTLRKGSCQYCNRLVYQSQCISGRSVSYQSFVDYECQMAIKDHLNIIVIYNYPYVKKEKCPLSVRYVGTHINGYYYDNLTKKWNYQTIKQIIMDL